MRFLDGEQPKTNPQTFFDINMAYKTIMNLISKAAQSKQNI